LSSSAPNCHPERSEGPASTENPHHIEVACPKKS